MVIGTISYRLLRCSEVKSIQKVSTALLAGEGISTSRQNICRIVFSDLLCIQYARDMHLFFSAFLAV